jgi:hypothetical protein
MLESELAEAKVQGKAVRNSRTDKINMLKRELDTEKIKVEHLKNQYFHKLLVCNEIYMFCKIVITRKCVD